MRDWLPESLLAHTDLLAWLAIISVITFVISVVLIPVVISRLPANYFQAQYRNTLLANEGIATIFIVAAKNLIGLILVIAGFLMFFIPGQGILTMLIGLGLMNFPGKYKMERKLVSRPAVLKSMNWIRSKAGVGPLLHPDHED